MSDMRSARHEMGKEVLAIFLLLMARACAFGVQYWPQLDLSLIHIWCWRRWRSSFSWRGC